MEGLLLLARLALFNSVKMNCEPPICPALCILRRSEHAPFQPVLGGDHIYRQMCEWSNAEHFQLMTLDILLGQLGPLG